MSSINLTFNVDPPLLGEMVEKNTLLDRYENVQKFCSLIHTSPDQGLPDDDRQIEEHRKYFGTNYIAPKMPRKLYEYILEPLKDKMLLIILIGGIIMFVTEMIKDVYSYGVDGLAIIIVVIIIVIVMAVNDYSKESQIKNLQKSIKTSYTCSVIRSGHVKEIKTADIVVGDVIVLKIGDALPADCVVISQSDLKIDESAITGESALVNKDQIKNPYLLAGTYVMDGTGVALVVAVGYNSQTGRILKLMGAAKPSNSKSTSAEKKASENIDSDVKGKSVLQEKLNKLAFILGIIGLVAGVLVITIYVVRFCIKTYGSANGRGFKIDDLKAFLGFLMEGFSLLVVSIPEGLPLAVTLSLAYSVRRMLKDKNLVRDLYSCETMGNATTICSDKTGTLTTNRMTVVKLFISQTIISDFSSVSSFDNSLKNSILLNICVNKNPSSYIKASNKSGSLPAQFGNKTDCALLGFISFFETDYDGFTSNFDSKNVAKTFVFNSEKKMMTSVIHETGDLYRILVKGAPDFLLPQCKFYYNREGIPVELTNSDRDIIADSLLNLARDSLRTILLAEKITPNIILNDDTTEMSLVSELVLVCIAGIEDPLRSDVPEAIAKCKRAGITVRMVTGDNIITARAIAKKCGIIEGNIDDAVMDSASFNKAIVDRNGNYDQRAFDELFPKLRVLARSSPRDKYVLVKGLIENNTSNKQIVAVTGDGTNDAPALKRADVGFAMGITGTDIAKEASDIIITDDNFASIVRAILWGRNIYDCISKFIQFQLTVNFATVILTIISTVYGSSKFLTPAQLLWLNVIMDSLASLALATAAPTDNLLLRKPYSRNRGLLSKNMVLFILLHGVFQVIIIMIVVLFGPSMFNVPPGFDNTYEEIYNDPNLDKPSKHGTMVFNIFVLMQLFNEINARTIHGERNVFDNIFKNKLFIIIMVASFFLQVIIVTFSNRVFTVVQLNVSEWGWCLLFGGFELIFHQICVVSVSKLVSIPKRFRIHTGFQRQSVSTETGNVDPHILWIRGVRKLQQELRVIKAFKECLVVRREFIESSLSVLVNPTQLSNVKIDNNISVK